MCGIVGYVGKKAVSSVLLVSLKKLEYRGYDSAGVAIIEDNEITTRKSVGKVEELENLMKDQFINDGAGIGHTRWATHGEANVLNAHPQVGQDKKIAIVHNGIIENYLELKKELKKHGYVCVSETDTEVVAHYIEYQLSQVSDLVKAFYYTIKKLKGKFSIAMLYEDEPNNLYFVSNGAPLILAYGKDEDCEGFISSDMPALIPIADRCYFLHNKEWGYFSGGEFTIFDWSHTKVNATFEQIKLQQEEDADKGSFDTFMLKEIHEQPDVISNILKHRIHTVNNKVVIKFDELNLKKSYLKKIGKVVIQACGSSLHAGLIGKRYIENFAKISADADFSSEFRYRNPVLDGDTLVIGISQSGETADTLGSLHSAKAKFLRVLSFVNNEYSTISRESDGIIKLMAGREIGVASTKAYVAELVNLFLFALYLAEIRGEINYKNIQKNIDNLRALPLMVSESLKDSSQVEKIADLFSTCSDVIFLGRSQNYPTALEGALKLKEVSYIHASGYAGGEFKHGPIALISDKIPVVVITPFSEVRDKIFSNLLEVKARKGIIVAIHTDGDEEVQKISDYTINIPKVDPELSPILCVVPLQLIAYYTALKCGCDVDRPRNLAKSVTVE